MEVGVIVSCAMAFFSIAGIFIAIGVFKGKVAKNEEENQAQEKRIEECATKTELTAASSRSDEHLAAAIKRSDEMLELMRKRAEEDRATGEGHYRELYGIINMHGERIASLETSQAAVMKSLDEIKNNINAGLHDIRQDIKELRLAKN